jgi:hypothetical protein
VTRRAIAGLVVVAVGPLGWCIALGAIVGGDPMLAVEITGSAVVVLWASLAGWELVRSQRLSRILEIGAEDRVLFGVAVRVTPSLGADAVVVGTLRPRIYVGATLVTTLAHDEMRAVLLHEDHHRRTRAPLRAAGLGAWLRLLGRSQTVRDLLVGRLTDLEMLADADAIRRGSSPRSLARALIKGDLSFQPVSFGYAAERRVEQLLDRAAGVPVDAVGRLPYEWLPMILLAAAALGCHAGL